jgi:RNA polymerase sigma factor (sigma-70 family)
MSRFRNNDETNRLVEGLAASCGNDLVRFIARRLRNVADARDLAHDAYVRLLLVKRADAIRDPRAYLYRIASNILYEFELKKKADAIGLTRWSEWQLADSDISQLECDSETLLVRERIETVLDQLSPKCRAVVILDRRDGMTYEEIGARVRISTSMVKKYVTRGVRHCREQLMELR